MYRDRVIDRARDHRAQLCVDAARCVANHAPGYQRHAPDLQARTAQGLIDIDQWIGGRWAILCLQPMDFAPACTTELGYMARTEPEFKKRDVERIGLSVDPVEHHERWSDDIEQTQGARPRLPNDPRQRPAVAKLHQMLPAGEPDGSEGRTAATDATVRPVLVIGPDKKIKLSEAYPGRGPRRRVRPWTRSVRPRTAAPRACRGAGSRACCATPATRCAGPGAARSAPTP